MGKRVLSILVVFVFVALAMTPIMANAQTNAGQGLEIAPPLLDIKANPGQVVTAQIRVRNVTRDSLVVKAQFEDFVAQGEEGQPRILLNTNEKSPYSIKDWLNAPANVTLAPQQREVVDVTITIPKDASPGGHYGVVRFTGTPPELGETGVSLSASVGTLMLVNVSGKVTQSAKVAELYASHGNKRGSLFEYGPITFTTRVQNTGNVHFQPKGTLQVTNMFGKNVYVGQFNQDNRNILPGSIRKFQQTMDKKLLFGRYNVRADVVYGTDSQITSAKTSFWVVPYKLIAIAILAIAALIFAFKRYNKFIIKRASKRQNNESPKSKKKAKKSQD